MSCQSLLGSWKGQGVDVPEIGLKDESLQMNALAPCPSGGQL